MIESEALHTLLAPLVGGRCYPVMFPLQPLPEWPAIRYTPVGGTTYADACGAGDGTADDVRVQIDAVAATYAGAVQLAAQVRSALMAFVPPAVADGPAVFQYDAETRTHRAVQDFTFYPSSSA